MAATHRSTVAAVIIALALASVAHADDASRRREKCAWVWSQAAPWSYSRALSDFLCGECERGGIPGEWYWQLVYGKANFSLRLRAVDSTGTCFGPLDVKWRWASGCRGMCASIREGRAWEPRILRDPWVNIRCGVAEAAYYHRRMGREGLALLATVFCPASPREYSRWRPVEREMRKLVAEWYEVN